MATACDQGVVKLEKTWNLWMEDMTTKRVPVDGSVLRQKALSLYEDLSKGAPCLADESSPNLHPWQHASFAGSPWDQKRSVHVHGEFHLTHPIIKILLFRGCSAVSVKWNPESFTLCAHSGKSNICLSSPDLGPPPQTINFPTPPFQTSDDTQHKFILRLSFSKQNEQPGALLKSLPSLLWSNYIVLQSSTYSSAHWWTEPAVSQTRYFSSRITLFQGAPGVPRCWSTE